MTARERLASARQSSNLADTPDKLTDVSVLAAAGMVATGEAVGMALLRLRDTMDASAWPFCVAAVATRVRGEFGGQKDRPAEREQHELAERILRAWVAPTCPSCDGRGHQKIMGTPLMSDDPCPVCNGSGRLSIDYGLKGQSRHVAHAVAIWMDKQAHSANARVHGKLYEKTVY